MQMYIGMDVHRKRTQLAILNEQGEELLNRNVPNDPGALLPLLAQVPRGAPVVFEAAYGWGWLADLLAELGFDAHLAHAARCRAIATARLKNDRVDARTLAHLLRTNLLAEAWIAPKPIRDLRLLLRHRTALVRLRTALRNRIHAILADYGFQPSSALWSRRGRRVLEALPLPPVHRRVVDNDLALIDALAAPFTEVDAQILVQARHDLRVEALRRLPGIGPRTALILLAEIGDIARFPTARKLCAWAGLTPTVRNSDRRVRHGGISKQGSAWVRWALVEAAQRARRDPLFEPFYLPIARRRGWRIATVAVARKLLTRCFYILQEVRPDQLGAHGDGPHAG